MNRRDRFPACHPVCDFGIDAGGGGDLLADGDIITDTESPTDIMDLVSKYAFGDVGSGEEE